MIETWKNGVRSVDCGHPLGIYSGSFARCPTCGAPSVRTAARDLNLVLSEHRQSRRRRDREVEFRDGVKLALAPGREAEVWGEWSPSASHAIASLASAVEKRLRAEMELAASPVYYAKGKFDEALDRLIAGTGVGKIVAVPTGRTTLSSVHRAGKAEATLLDRARRRLLVAGLDARTFRFSSTEGRPFVSLRDKKVALDVANEDVFAAFDEALDRLIAACSPREFPAPPTTWEEVAKARPDRETLKHWVAEHGWRECTRHGLGQFFTAPPSSPIERRGHVFAVMTDGRFRRSVPTVVWQDYTPEARS